MFSVVIPVYNEAESLALLHGEISDVAAAHDYALEIVFVDDGSSDDSWRIIQSISAADPRVRGVRFRRNFGKAAALSAGFAAARGEIVFTMDADLQDNPKEIPRFLEEMGDDLDVVSGWKQVRHDPWHKVLPSRVFNGMVSWLTGVHLHDHNCGFKCYRREIFDEVRLYGELHRFVPVLAAARGYKVGEIVVDHRARQYGQSKYGVRRIVKGFLDLLTVKFLTGFGQRPQHVLGSVGLLFFVVSIFLLTFLTVRWGMSRLDADPLNDLHLHASASFYYTIVMLLLGGQFMSMGFLAEMITAFNTHDGDHFSISDKCGRPQLGDSTTKKTPETIAHEGDLDS